GVESAAKTLSELSATPYQDLLEFSRLTELLAYPRATNPLDHAVAPRGYRVLSHIPRLTDAVVKRVVRELGSLEAIVRASQRELEQGEGVGWVGAGETGEGPRRLQDHTRAERSLQL